MDRHVDFRWIDELGACARSSCHGVATDTAGALPSDRLIGNGYRGKAKQPMPPLSQRIDSWT